MLEKDDLELIHRMIQETLKPIKAELSQIGENPQRKDILVDDMLIEQTDQRKRTGFNLQAYHEVIRRKKTIDGETRKARVIFNKAGGSASKGSQTTRITLPIRWVREMGITEASREVNITFQNGRIIIEKMESENNEPERKEKEG